MDAVDLAQAQEEALDQRFLAKARAAEPPPATGFCLNCGETLAPGVRFCNADCRDDFERLDAALRRRGL